MSKFRATLAGKSATVIVGITAAVYMSGAAALIPAVAQAETCSYSFTLFLKLGKRGTEVLNLQKVLNMDADTQVATTGAGSPGSETSYFGSKTVTAVKKFQAKYGLVADALVGAKTRAELNEICSGSQGGGGVVVPVGGGLAVSSATQPTASLAPQGAARVPFTKVTLTAGNSDVAINGLKIERTGLAQDAVFSGVVLLDEAGLQVGLAKTFNSDHQATIGEAMILRAGTSKTFTVAGNMASSLTAYAGQVAFLSVVGVDTTATVSGTPVTGAGHTINASLTIGSVSMARGVVDPGANQTKEVGATGINFSAVKLTAGSAEKVRVMSLRWNQSGSAAAGDLANVKTYVNGAAYDTVVSSDGKYYTTTFGAGLSVDKGASLELAIKGDILSGSGRTIAFDVYKNTDLYVVGETYGYGIAAPTTGSAGVFGSTNPWYDAYVVTVSNGTLNVEKATSVASQNISANVNAQVLGGFTSDVKGEAISVSSLVFTVASSSGSGTGLLTNVSLYDEGGSVVAGPVDGVYSTATTQTVTYSSTVTFPIGKKTYTLKGKVASGIGSNTQYVISFNPQTAFTSAVGQTTGNSITVTPNSTVTLNTMTVKSVALAISVSPNPAAQTVVGGGRFTFANYQFDATASGDDVRIQSIPLAYEAFGGTATNLTSCQLMDGTTALNTGSNIVSPSAAGSSTVFVLDNAGLTITRGTTKTIALSCDIAGGASGSYAWGLDSGATFSATGVNAGSFTPTATDSTGQKMTLSSGGTLTVSLDSSSPAYAIVAAGTTGNTLSVLKFHAANEAINVNKVKLQLTNTASSSASDLVSVKLYKSTDLSNAIGEAVFTGSGTYATSTLNTPLVVPKDGDAKLVIKGDMANIGASEVGVSGHLIAVDYDGGDLSGTQGVGVNSGTTVSSTSASDTASAGVRLFKGYPIFTYSTTAGVASNGVNELLTLNVQAGSNDIALNQLTFTVATTTATLTNVYLNGPSGRVASTVYDTTTGTTVTVAFDSVTNTNDKYVPAGTTKSYVLRGTVALTGTNTTGSVSTALTADTSFPSLAASTFMAKATDLTATSNLVWSPQSTTTSVVAADFDWTNGYGLGGCFATSGIGQNCIARVISK